MERRSASPNPSHVLRPQSKPRPISSFAASTPNLNHFPSSTLSAPLSIQTLSQLGPLSIPSSTNAHIPPIRSTLVDVVVEGMGGGHGPGEGWQVPPELVFFLRSLGERLDPFNPTDRQPRSISGLPPNVGHTKSLTAALNHATLRPETDHTGVVALFTELVITERTYLKRITALNQSYATPLRQFSKSSSTKIIDKYEATSMFGKIDGVVRANSSLLVVLESCLFLVQRNELGWAEQLSEELLKIQKPYRDYLAGYDSIKETEQRLLKKSESFRQFCERTKEAMYDDGMGRVGLRELLMEPVQRVTRYILIFEQLLKKMSSSDPSRDGLLACISTCNSVAVCELDDHLIKAATMWGLSRSIDHFPAILVKPGRYFIDSIDVLDIVSDTPSPTALHCTLFLFNDTIVIAKKPSNGNLSGRLLAGLDDLDKLVAAMKKSKGTSSSLNSVMSGSTDFLAKSLGGSHHNTPIKLKKGSMRFKGMVDVHDVMVTNEPNQVALGGATEVSFDLYLDRPPQDVSERWSDRPHRHFVVCPPVTGPAGHEKSQSLSSHSTPGASHHPHHQHSHSLSSRSSHLNTTAQQVACLAERDRFLDNLRRSQALVKAVDDRSTVMRTRFVNDQEGGGVIDSYWNLYDKRTYLTEQRKHKVALQLVGTDQVEPLQFTTDAIEACPPLIIIRANFNEPDDPDCRVKIRRKSNHLFPYLSNASGERLESEEEVVVNGECLSSLIVRIIMSYRLADLPPRMPSFYSAPGQQHGTLTGPNSPTRGFRNKTNSINDNGLQHRMFGNTNHSPHSVQRAKSFQSSTVGSAGSKPHVIQSVARQSQGSTRSPGGPVWYRNGFGGMGVMPEEEDDQTTATINAAGMKNSESNPSLYDEPEIETPSPLRSTLKGKGRSQTSDDRNGEETAWVEAGDESRCSSVSGLTSCDEEDNDEKPRRVNGPRQLADILDSPPREASESSERIDKTRGEIRQPSIQASKRFEANRIPSGSSIGKRSRSVGGGGDNGKSGTEDETDRGAKRVASARKVSPLAIRKSARNSSNEERDVINRRQRNLTKADEVQKRLVGIGIGTQADGKESFGEIKKRVQKMKFDIKKIKEEIGRLEAGGTVKPLKEKTIGNQQTCSIPRSPRKLHLSDVANNLVESEMIGMIKKYEKNINELEKEIEKVEKINFEGNQQMFEGFQKDLEIKEKEIEKKTNEIKKLEIEYERLESINKELEIENNHLYEAFNEELDKMYGDIQLPPGEAINSLILDLKRMAEERGKLITQLGFTKRQLETELARSKFFEKTLREAGLLT